MQYFIILIIGFFIWYNTSATKSEKKETNRVVKQIIGVDKSNIKNELSNLIIARRDLMGVKLATNEKLRYQLYQDIDKVNRTLEKYISFNGKDQYSNDVRLFIRNEEQWLKLISNNISLLKRLGSHDYKVASEALLEMDKLGISDKLGKLNGELNLHKIQ